MLGLTVLRGLEKLALEGQALLVEDEKHNPLFLIYEPLPGVIRLVTPADVDFAKALAEQGFHLNAAPACQPLRIPVNVPQGARLYTG